MGVRVVAGLVACALLAAGCGSTVEGREERAAEFDDPQLGGRFGGEAGATGDALTAPDTTATPRGGTGRSGATGRRAASTLPSAKPGAVRPGVTSKHVVFGAYYDPGAAAANAALGASGIDPGDVRRYYDAAAADVNAHGGVAGRELKPLYMVADSSTPTAAQRAQEACEYFTRDHKIFAVVDGFGDDVSLHCYFKAGVVNINTGFSQATADTFRKFPNYVEVSSLNLDRLGVATVEGLAQTDYFAGKPKVGFVTWDHPSYRAAAAAGWLPAFARLGITPTVRYVAVADGSAGTSRTSAEVSNAVLRFRQSGVDRVLMGDGPAGTFAGTGLTLLFIQAARGQGYYPRYGLNSTNSPQAGIDEGFWGSPEMDDALEVAWGGIDDRADEGITPNPHRARCLKIMRDHGLALDNSNARGAALSACDVVWMLQAGLAAGGNEPTVTGFISGVNRLGSTYGSPLAYRTRFDANRHDGAAAARRSAYDRACTCFKFTTQLYALP